jgi:hypothetical protein
MFKFILLAALLFAAAAVHHHEHEEQHYDHQEHSLAEDDGEASHEIGKIVDWGCCGYYGGVVCGTTFPECCSGGCRPGLVAGSTCVGRKIQLSSKRCPTSCANTCRRAGGVICGTSVTSEDCCYPMYCSGLLVRTCAAGTKIPLGNCMPNTAFSKWRW